MFLFTRACVCVWGGGGGGCAAIEPTPNPAIDPPPNQQVKWAGDCCCVCDGSIDYDVDQLVSCDGCGIVVHQSCYGIPEAPGKDDMWLCRWAWAPAGPVCVCVWAYIMEGNQGAGPEALRALTP